MAEVPDTVDVALDALSSPTSDEVSAATEGFSAREIATASAARALDGGGASSPFTVIGPVTLTAADFAANWDDDNDEGGAPVTELLAGDLVWEYRVVVTTQVAVVNPPGNFVTLGVVDAGPGSWATPFATTPTNVAGDTGPSFIQANAAAASEQGSLMTTDDTLYLVYGDAGGPPIVGDVTVWVFVVRPA